jgi:hypothetical protein
LRICKKQRLLHVYERLKSLMAGFSSGTALNPYARRETLQSCLFVFPDTSGLRQCKIRQIH